MVLKKKGFAVKKTNAYEMGYNAGYKGWASDEYINPFESDTKEYQEWNTGANDGFQAYLDIARGY